MQPLGFARRSPCSIFSSKIHLPTREAAAPTRQTNPENGSQTNLFLASSDPRRSPLRVDSQRRNPAGSPGLPGLNADLPALSRVDQAALGSGRTARTCRGWLGRIGERWFYEHALKPTRVPNLASWTWSQGLIERNAPNVWRTKSETFGKIRNFISYIGFLQVTPVPLRMINSGIPYSNIFKHIVFKEVM